MYKLVMYFCEAKWLLNLGEIYISSKHCINEMYQVSYSISALSSKIQLHKSQCWSHWNTFLSVIKVGLITSPAILYSRFLRCWTIVSLCNLGIPVEYSFCCNLDILALIADFMLNISSIALTHYWRLHKNYVYRCGSDIFYSRVLKRSDIKKTFIMVKN